MPISVFPAQVLFSLKRCNMSAVLHFPYKLRQAAIFWQPISVTHVGVGCLAQSNNSTRFRNWQ